MKIRPARKEEVGIVLQLIHDLAHYEKAPNEVEATEKELLATIFIDNPKVFCDVVDVDGESSERGISVAVGNGVFDIKDNVVLSPRSRLSRMQDRVVLHDRVAATRRVGERHRHNHHGHTARLDLPDLKRLAAVRNRVVVAAERNRRRRRLTRNAAQQRRARAIRAVAA